MFFSESKFRSLSLKAQHKWASRLLHKGHSDPKELIHYRIVEKWLSLPPAETLEMLSARYHYHLEIATIQLKEDRFLLPEMRHLDTLSEEPFLDIDIYLDNLRSAHNVGSILRTTEAMRLGSVHFSEKSPNTDHPQVRRASMGTYDLVNTSCKRGLKTLTSPFIALETTDKAIPIDQFKFPKKFTLIVGNEEYGVSPASLAMCEAVVFIPLVGMKNSVNVASAFSICAYEIRRQMNSL